MTTRSKLSVSQPSASMRTSSARRSIRRTGAAVRTRSRHGAAIAST